MNTLDPLLQQLLENGILRPIDMHVGRYILRLSKGKESPLTSLAAAFVSRAAGEGHVCLPLANLAAEISKVNETNPIQTMDLQTELKKSSTVGQSEDSTPLILTNNDLLYLHKYYRFEENIHKAIQSGCRKTDSIDLNQGKKILSQLFAKTSGENTLDWQLTAAAMALLKPLLVISGGPGTGKTYTVARIIAALHAIHPHTFRVCLAAPTGKAATRLKESLQVAKTSLPDQFAHVIPSEASTIHRLLQFNPSKRQFQHNKDNPLHLDLLIIDEASMIDIVLMASIFEALPANCRLILLGDKNQLSSVEAGNLFGDICGDTQPRWSQELQQQINSLTGQAVTVTKNGHAIENNLLFLQKSYRFHEHSGIGTLATAVNSQDRKTLHHSLTDGFSDLTILHPESEDLADIVNTFTHKAFTSIFKSDSPVEALTRFEQSRILCATHKGDAGVERANRLVESLLIQQNCISTAKWYYKGQPIMILTNDYGLDLFNGDIGIIWPDNAGELRCWFHTTDKPLRSVSLPRLPEHQTCYAMTVHKSQGSEFDYVLFIVPQADSPVSTCELLYTGITRAKKHLTLFTTPEMLVAASKRSSIRFSGLYEKLRH